MTSEHKVVIGVQDIRRVTLECAKCSVRLTFSPDRCSIPKGCPNPECDSIWMPTLHAYPPSQRKAPARVEFVETICNLRRVIEDAKVEQGGEPDGFHVLLEFDDPAT